MISRQTLKVFLASITLFALLALPGLVWPSYYDSPLGLVVAVPYISIYLFHNIGIPGLLQNNGACGWGWCAPTTFGWVFLAVVWLAAAWLLAWGISAVIRSARKTHDSR